MFLNNSWLIHCFFFLFFFRSFFLESIEVQGQTRLFTRRFNVYYGHVFLKVPVVFNCTSGSEPEVSRGRGALLDWVNTQIHRPLVFEGFEGKDHLIHVPWDKSERKWGKTVWNVLEEFNTLKTVSKDTHKMFSFL